MSQMKMVQLGCGAFLSAVLCLSFPHSAAAEDAEAKKPTIKEVMKSAFKGPLVKKVASGKATDEEKKSLHDMLVAMSEDKPPRGDEASWKKFTTALVDSSKAVVDGDKKGVGMLKKSADCKACHTDHKPN